MSALRLLRLLAAAVLIAAPAAHAAPPAPQSRGVSGEFDYYILALTWSPQFCAGPKGKQAPEQCAAPEPRPGFVVNGLWPQYDKGGNPENCQRVEPVAADLVEAIHPIMPGESAIQQAWRKYGSCSGLSADYYFADLRIAFERVKLPDILKQPAGGLMMPAIDAVDRIVEANPDLPHNSIAGVCVKGQLTEVRLCLNKDLEPRTCGARITANCGPKDRLTVR